MGACATKPKVLKDGDEKPVSPPPMPQPEKEGETVAQRESENDASVAPIESPAKNSSLGNLLILETEDAKVSDGNENENAANSSYETEAIKASELMKGNTEALGFLPAPSRMADAPIEKVPIQAPEIIAKQNTVALYQFPEPTVTIPDEPVQKEAITGPEIVAKEYTEDSDKLPATSTKKIDSQISEIVPEDFADALPTPPLPVVSDRATEKLAVKGNENALENVDRMVVEKSIAESLEKIPTPKKITSQASEDYTDAIGTDEVVVLKNKEKALESLEQEDLKESDIKEVKSLEILSEK